MPHKCNIATLVFAKIAVFFFSFLSQRLPTFRAVSHAKSSIWKTHGATKGVISKLEIYYSQVFERKGGAKKQ
jgi:hypothetical protein